MPSITNGSKKASVDGTIFAAGVYSGFQNAFGDLGFIGKFGKNEEITVVMDLYLSSRNHPSQTYGNEGYILLRGVPENLESLKFLKPVLDKVHAAHGVRRAGQFDRSRVRLQAPPLDRDPVALDLGAQVVFLKLRLLHQPMGKPPQQFRLGAAALIPTGPTPELIAGDLRHPAFADSCSRETGYGLDRTESSRCAARCGRGSFWTHSCTRLASGCFFPCK